MSECRKQACRAFYLSVVTAVCTYLIWPLRDDDHEAGGVFLVLAICFAIVGIVSLVVALFGLLNVDLLSFLGFNEIHKKRKRPEDS